MRCIRVKATHHQGERQWVILEFPHPVKVSELRIQFQGGFSAGTCKLEGKRLYGSPQTSPLIKPHVIYVVFHIFSPACLKEGDFNAISHFYPEDNNCLQISFSPTV